MAAESSSADVDLPKEEFVVGDDFKTYIVRRNSKGKKTQRKCFQDFALKLIGEMPTENSITWVGHLIARDIDESCQLRVLIRQEDLCSTKLYVAAVRQSYSKANDAEGMTKENLRSYVQYLKEKYYQAGNIKEYAQSRVIGYLGNNYWILSQDDHYKGRKKVAKTDQEYFYVPLVTKYRNKKLEINDFLLNDVTFLLDSLKKFKRFADKSFGVNAFSFHLAISFALRHLLKVMSGEREGADEPKFGILYSSSKSCGKSTIQKIVAFGQGLSSTKESPFFVGGGNMNSSGTSSTLLRDLVGITNLLINVDDIENVPKHIDTVLHQFHDGYAQGVKESGLVTLEAGLLFSSNEGITTKMCGRIIVIPFETYNSEVVEESFSELTTNLMPLVSSMRGFLIAWTMWFSPLQENVKVLQEQLTKALRIIASHHQPRYILGWSSLLAVHILFQLTCGETAINLEDILKKSQKILSKFYIENDAINANKEHLAAIIADLEIAIRKKIKANPDETSHWLNMNVSFGKSIKAIAIEIETLNQSTDFINVNVKDLKEMLGNSHGEVVYQPVRFAEIDGKRKRVKALKVPKSLFSNGFLSEIAGDLQVLDEEDADEEASEEVDNGNECDDDEFDLKVDADILDLIKRKILVLNVALRRQISGIRSELEENNNSIIGKPFHENLSPTTKRSYMKKSNACRQGFNEGYDYAMKKISGVGIEFAIELDNTLNSEVNVQLIYQTKTYNLLVGKNQTARKTLQFHYGESCTCSAKTEAGQDGLLESKRRLSLSPERPGQVFKIKVTGIVLDNSSPNIDAGKYSSNLDE